MKDAEFYRPKSQPSLYQSLITAERAGRVVRVSGARPARWTPPATGA